MKLHRKVCILLVSVVMAQLCSGCRIIIPSNSPLAAPSFEGYRYGDPADYDSYYTQQTDDPSGEEAGQQEAVTVWDVNHGLNIEFTPAADLELPVVGATGYASVELYLWRDQPTGESYKLANLQRTQVSAGTTPSADPQPSQQTPAATWDPSVPGTDGANSWGQSAPSVDTAIPWNQPASGVDGAVPQAADPTVTVEGTSLVHAWSAAPASAAGSSADVVTLSGSALTSIAKLKAGTPFTILQEVGDWWQVRAEQKVGWIEHRYCLINLPDVIPSMIYDDTNSYQSVFRSCGKDIPNITDQQLYNAKAYNPRLGHDEFMMPVLYAMARKVCLAQQHALAEGNSLILYEGYRPYDTQMAVVKNLRALAAVDAEVKAGISTPPWNISWFIATGISNHQEGYAMDVGLAKVTEAHMNTISGYSYVQVDQYEVYTMPTPIHELSMAACTYTGPVSIFSYTAWQSGTMSPTMAVNEPAKALQRYCTTADMTPLASEWWHFNDLEAYYMANACHSKGNYFIEDCLSLPPDVVAF